jgi:hypothetical protein
MKKIFKYPLPIEYKNGEGAGWNKVSALSMPEGAEILSVGLQDGKAMMWALVDPDAPVAGRSIAIVNTGGSIGGAVPESFCDKFIGTLIFGDGRIILHVFG